MTLKTLWLLQPVEALILITFAKRLWVEDNLRSFFLTSSITPSCNLPVDQSQSVDISTLERIEMLHVDRFI